MNPLGSSAGIFYFQRLSLCILILVSVRAYAQPRLHVDEPKKNFGFVKRGTLIKNEYKISNTGNEPLMINAAEISCSCTTVDFPKQPILPGQTVKVQVNFNTTTVYGRQDRVVYLNSNDPNGPSKLRYKGTVSNK